MGGGSSTITPEQEFVNGGEAVQQKSEPPRQNKPNSCCYCFYFDDQRSDREEDDEKRILREEARTWETKFERLLRHPVGQKVFQEFLQAQFSDENLRFWIEAEQYFQMTDEERSKRAKTLYEDFVSSISPCEVSLNACHRNQIEKNMADAPKNLFKSAQDYIYCLMYRDCFPRFLKSKTYRRLCR